MIRGRLVMIKEYDRDEGIKYSTRITDPPLITLL